jgi:hypothetical protein
VNNIHDAPLYSDYIVATKKKDANKGEIYLVGSPVLATSLIRLEKANYHVVLLLSHNYLEQHDEQIPWPATSALNTENNRYPKK